MCVVRERTLACMGGYVSVCVCVYVCVCLCVCVCVYVSVCYNREESTLAKIQNLKNNVLDVLIQFIDVKIVLNDHPHFLKVNNLKMAIFMKL